MLESFLIALCGFLFNACTASIPQATLSLEQRNEGQRLIKLKGQPPHEISGLTPSAKHKNILWVHNDGGNPPEIIAINSKNGRVKHRIAIQNADNRDWEDIARFHYQQQNWLLLADIGDNFSTARHLTLYAFPEPKLESTFIEANWQIRFRYGDGARDAEAIAVDPINNQILVLSKRDLPPRLYSLPLQPSTKVETARFLGTLHHIPAPTAEDLTQDPWYGKYRNQPTAMGISQDGQRRLIVTLKDSYLYSRHANGWGFAIQQPPQRIDTPQLPQTEAGDFSADDQGVWVASETLPAQLFYTPLP